jgi:hypothetical protein
LLEINLINHLKVNLPMQGVASGISLGLAAFNLTNTVLGVRTPTPVSEAIAAVISLFELWNPVTNWSIPLQERST